MLQQHVDQYGVVVVPLTDHVQFHALKVLPSGLKWSYQTLLAMAAQPELLQLQATAAARSGGGSSCMDEQRPRLEGRFHAAEMEGVPLLLFAGTADTGGSSKSIALRRLPSEPVPPFSQVSGVPGQGFHQTLPLQARRGLRVDILPRSILAGS